MRRLLWVGMTFILFFILYKVLAKGGTIEGGAAKRKLPTPQEKCSKFRPKSNGQKNENSLKNQIYSSCLINPENFQKCTSIIYGQDLPKPSTDVAVASINKCMNNLEKYKECFNGLVTEDWSLCLGRNCEFWTKDNPNPNPIPNLTLTYDEILEKINSECDST